MKERHEEAINMAHVSEAAKVITRVIDDANEEVLISTGTLHHDCFNTGFLVDSVRNALNRKVKFTVLTGPVLDKESKLLISILKDNIVIASSKPKVHFAIADGGKRIRFEKKDLDDNLETDNAERRLDYVTGSYLKDRFIATLKDTKPYKEIVEEEKQDEKKAGTCKQH